MAKNVLLITADQLRADALGCYGNPVIRTPAIDDLASAGTVFENAFTPNPICVPARASITTRKSLPPFSASSAARRNQRAAS